MLTNEQRYKMILRDYGYKLLRDGDKYTLVGLGLAGYYADRLLPGKHSTAMGAAESLIPVIHDDEYTNRVKAVGVIDRVAPLIATPDLQGEARELLHIVASECKSSAEFSTYIANLLKRNAKRS